MAVLSNHTERDAAHAARQEIRTHVMRYVRRMDELAKAEIKEAIEEATQKGEPIDGTALGKAAAAHAIGAYIGTGEPKRAIKSKAAEVQPPS